MLCLGCGEDISNRSSDRRSLTGRAEAKRVYEAWMSLVEAMQCEFTDEEEAECVERWLSGSSIDEKMCRKCFSSFERYDKLTCELKEKLGRSVSNQAQGQAQEQTVVTKRPRISASNSEKDSPTVSVSLLALCI